jgi:TolB-like protein/Flp pilus assembly protein TadD/predicted Ser/Thr protein kinase
VREAFRGFEPLDTRRTIRGVGGPPVTVGQTVSHYRVLETLGRGGMGVVYRALDTTLGRPVALKFLTRSVGEDPNRLERLRREARAASALNHPGICTVYEIGSHEGEPFIAMELLEGKTLRQHACGRPMDPDELLDVAIQVCGALEAAHSHGIIHRDIKPENVFVTSGGLAKLLDFGLVKRGPRPCDGGATRTNRPPEGDGTREQALTREGTLVGTVEYMSPEQARGEVLDTRSDLFSLGAVLYEMATGWPPFGGGTVAATVDAILNQSPVPPARLRQELSPELEAIVERALQKRREARYQHASDMRADLQRLKDAGIPGQDQGPEADVAGPPGAPPGSPGGRPTGWVRRPVLVLSAVAVLCGFAVAGWLLVPKPAPRAVPLRLAVLPFANLTGDPGREYLGDGLTEELITDLGRLRDLGVIARTTVMKYKRSPKGVGQIARELKVDLVLEGSVRQADRRLRVTAQLIRASDETHLWAENYDREVSDVLAVQGDVARSVAREIQMRLPAPTSPHRPPPEAQLAYLRGRHEWEMRTEESFKRGIVFFQEAIRLDPEFARAYSGLADSYLLLGFYGHLPTAEALAVARPMAQRALALDQGLADGHASLAFIQESHDWDFPKADASYRRALELNPNDTTALNWYGLSLLERGRVEEARAVLLRARDADPLSPVAVNGVADCDFYAGLYERAIEQYRALLESEPEHGYTWWGLGRAYTHIGRHAEAIAALEKARDLSGGDPVIVAQLGYGYARAGERVKAERVLEGLESRPAQGGAMAYAEGIVEAGLGDRQAAIARLLEVCAARHPMALWIRVEPEFEALRSDAPFQESLRRAGL